MSLNPTSQLALAAFDAGVKSERERILSLLDRCRREEGKPLYCLADWDGDSFGQHCESVIRLIEEGSNDEVVDDSVA